MAGEPSGVKKEPVEAKRAATMSEETAPSSGGRNMFDGTQDYQKWRTWARGKAMFRRSNSVKAAEYIFDCLQGTPAEMVMLGAADEGDPFGSAEAIFSILDRGYGAKGGESTQEAERQLMRLRQRGRSLQDYIIEFQSLAVRTSFSESAKLAALQAGVAQSLAPAAAMLDPDIELGKAIQRLQKVDAMTPRSQAGHGNQSKGSSGGKTRGRQSSTKDMSKVTCFNCQQKGHYKDKCPEPEDKKGKRPAKGRKAKKPEPEDSDDDIVEHESEN
jgi:hypothetical protein